MLFASNLQYLENHNHPTKNGKRLGYFHPKLQSIIESDRPFCLALKIYMNIPDYLLQADDGSVAVYK